MLGPSGFFLPSGPENADTASNDLELIHTSKDGFNELYRVCKNGRFFVYKALKEEFRGNNGFVYEIEETVKCIKKGRTESDIMPHSATIECVGVFDKLSSISEENLVAQSSSSILRFSSETSPLKKLSKSLSIF